MLRPIAALLLLAGAAIAQPVAFERGGAVWLGAIGETKARKIARGAWPALAPDGARLAFNTQENDTPQRFIAVVDLTTGAKRVFRDVPSDNAFGPTWSPDGRRLAFSIFVDDDWRLAIIDADGTGFRLVKNPATKGRTWWGAAWAADGRSFFCHDLSDLFEIDLEGKILRRWSLGKLFPRGGLSSGSHLAPSPDGRALLIDVDMDEGAERDEWTGPPPAIWRLDLATGEVTRLTAPDAFAWHPCWLSDRELLVNSWPAGQREIGISRLAVDGASPARLVIKNARTPSAPTPRAAAAPPAR